MQTILGENVWLVVTMMSRCICATTPLGAGRSGVTSAINNIEGNLVDSRAMIPAPNDRSVATIKWCSGGVVGCEVVPELG